MKFLKSAQEVLSKVELANASKVYTPFTVFCFFFAIYFNAEILGKIFLSGDWKIQLNALETVRSKGYLDWVAFLSKVFLYGASATLLYGLAQAVAGLFWLAATKLNILFAYFLDKTGYESISVVNELREKLVEQKGKERFLQEKIKEISGWEPDEFLELRNRVDTAEANSKKYSDENAKAKSTIIGLKDNLKNSNAIVKTQLSILKNLNELNTQSEISMSDEEVFKAWKVVDDYGFSSSIKPADGSPYSKYFELDVMGVYSSVGDVRNALIKLSISNSGSFYHGLDKDGKPSIMFGFSTSKLKKILENEGSKRLKGLEPIFEEVNG